MVVLELALFFLAALLYLGCLGFAPARLLLHGPLAEYRILALPLLGLCAFVTAASYLSLLLPTAQVTWLLLVLAMAVNAGIVLRTQRIGLPRPARGDLSVLALSLLAYILGVLPLVHAGSTAFLGVQWDLEIYLPLTEYLKAYPAWGPFPAPPNPLLESVNSVPVRAGSGLGFSLLDAAFGTLLGRASFETFRPALQLVFALSVPSVYLFCRAGLRLATMPALIAAALTAVNGLNLWVASIGLAGHAVTLALLPLAFAFSHHALTERSRPAVALAVLVISAMLSSFYTGALAIFVLGAVAVGVSHLIDGPQRRYVLGTGLAIAAGVALLAAIAHLRFLQLLPLYAQQGFSEGWHIMAFSPINEAMGLSPFALVAERLGPDLWWGLEPQALARAAGWVSLGALGLWLAAFLRQDWERRLLVALAVGFLGLGLYLRFFSDYPYGYFKLLSLTSFVLLAGIGQGLAVLWQGASGGLPHWFGRLVSFRPAIGALRAGVAALSLLFVLLLAGNTANSMRYFWTADEHELPAGVWELDGLRTALPTGAPVYLASRAGFNPRTAAILAYFLRDYPLVGNIRTAYGEQHSQRPDEQFDYLVLAASEPPEERGLDARDLVWGNNVAAAYRRPQGWLTSVDLESTQQAIPLQQAEPLTLRLAADRWSLIDGAERARGSYRAAQTPYQVEFTMLNLGPSTMGVRLAGSQDNVALPAGLVRYRTPPLQLPSDVELALLNEMHTPTWLLGLRVVAADDAKRGAQRSNDLLVLQPQATIKNGLAELTVEYSLTDRRGGAVALAVEVYQRGGASNLGVEPVGFWQLNRARQEGAGRATFVLDAAAWQCGASAATLRPQHGRPLQDGRYEAHLAVYYVGQEVQRWPWLAFDIAGGQVNGPQTQPLPPYVVQYLPIPNEVRQLERALPPDASVILPGASDPDGSFIVVARHVLADRFTNEQTGTPRYGLLPHDEPHEAWGFASAEKVWSNREAVLLRSDRPSSGPPPHDITLQATARLNKSTGKVTVQYHGPQSPGIILGIDFYGERVCDLAHYGWWAIDAAAAGERMEISIDLPHQRAAFLTPSGTPLDVGNQTWPVNDGPFRAFLFLKQGDHFDTAPLFDFVLREGRIVDFRAYPTTKYLNVQ